ncbi:MAG: type IV pilin protein, partial [Planctomycetota bacterium]
MMKRMRRNEEGFTLIELLIVVIILGILAAAVIPLFSDQSTKARVATMKSDIAAMRSQFSLFKVEHGLP